MIGNGAPVVYARFGQELYIRETIAAAVLIGDHAAEDAQHTLGARLADLLPHDAASTRNRIAAKLLQRITAGACSCSTKAAANPLVTAAESNSSDPLFDHGSGGIMISLEEAMPPPASVVTFARLLAHLQDTQAQWELVYYSAARADRLIGAIAHHILYPYFIEGCIPAPYSEDEFIMANASLLLAPEPILTTGFVAAYARRAWGFDSERTVCLALRVLRQAGILLSAPLLGIRGRVAAYTLAPHGLSMPALLWAFYNEFGRHNLAPAWDQAGRAHLARLFVVPPSVVTSRLWDAERAGLVGAWSAGGIRRVALKVREPEALARLLLCESPRLSGALT